MKTLIKLIVIVLSINFSNAQQDKGHTITVSIDNVRNDKGKVIISLRSAETFMKGKGLDSGESKIKDGKITVTFKNVKPGTYALLALHDENGNYMMDFEGNGMPKEDYGMSNNPVFFGPPQFNDAKFELTDKDLDFKIKF